MKKINAKGRKLKKKKGRRKKSEKEIRKKRNGMEVEENPQRKK